MILIALASLGRTKIMETIFVRGANKSIATLALKSNLMRSYLREETKSCAPACD